MSRDLTALGPLSRAHHRGHEAAGTVEHDDRLEALVVVMSVEQLQLLATMHAIESKPLIPGTSSVIRFGTCASEAQ